MTLSGKKAQRPLFVDDFDEPQFVIPRIEFDETVGLLRYSRRLQEEGSSESRQLLRILAICRQYGWPEPSLWLTDRGVSAFRINPRTGKTYNLSDDAALGKFIKDVLDGKITKKVLLIVENVDRFSRAELDDADQALMDLLRHGVSVFFVSIPMLLVPGDQHDDVKRGKIMAEFKRSNRESKRKSKLLKASFDIRMEEAKTFDINDPKSQQPSFGNIAPHWVRYNHAVKRYLKVVQICAALLQIAKDLIANKVHNQIVQKLNVDRIALLAGGKRWTTSTLYMIFRNPAVIGTLRINGVEVEDFYPPLLTREQHKLVLAALSVKMKPGGGTRADCAVRNLFPSRVVCHHCGMPMRAASGAGSFASRVYVCRGHEESTSKDKNTPICSETRANFVDAIELDVIGLLLGQLPSMLILQRDEGRQAEIAAIQSEITATTNDIHILREFYRAAPTPETMQEAEKANAKRQKLEKKLAEVIKESRVAPGADRAWEELVKLLTARTNLKGLDDKTLWSALKQIDNFLIELADNELRKSLIGPLKRIVQSVVIDSAYIPGLKSSACNIRRTIRYYIELLGGATTEWRDVSKLNKDLGRTHYYAGLTPERLQRRSEMMKKHWAEHPFTAEHRAKISKAGKGRRKTAAEREKVRQAQLARHARIRAARLAAGDTSMTPEERRKRKNQRELARYYAQKALKAANCSKRASV
jgi:hypothetical protein